MNRYHLALSPYNNSLCFVFKKRRHKDRDRLSMEFWKLFHVSFLGSMAIPTRLKKKKMSDSVYYILATCKCPPCFPSFEGGLSAFYYSKGLFWYNFHFSCRILGGMICYKGFSSFYFIYII